MALVDRIEAALRTRLHVARSRGDVWSAELCARALSGHVYDDPTRWLLETVTAEVEARWSGHRIQQPRTEAVPWPV